MGPYFIKPFCTAMLFVLINYYTQTMAYNMFTAKLTPEPKYTVMFLF